MPTRRRPGVFGRPFIITKTPTAVWLTRAHITDDPEGDLIGDMRGDMLRGVEIPALFASAEAMAGWLRCQGACAEALAAVPGAWLRYRRWQDRHSGARWAHLSARKRDPQWKQLVTKDARGLGPDSANP